MGNRAPRLSAATLIVPDLRTPGHPMAPLPLKIPAAVMATLQAQADRLGTSRGALARTLVLRGLEQLQAPAGEVA
ncbi:MAG: hypothetical protein VKM34_04155 [Cyanobacteriota bacterium]|nr:hypothetical protein [Cyanobacteriota bacterium]